MENRDDDLARLHQAHLVAAQRYAEGLQEEWRDRVEKLAQLRAHIVALNIHLQALGLEPIDIGRVPRAVERVVKLSDLSEHAAAMSRRGSAKGGHARAANMAPERRREIAQKAAQTRWAKRAEAS